MKGKLRSVAKEISTFIKPLPIKTIQLEVPYHSQFESPELVEKFINKEELPRNDPNWKKSGATSPLEYEFWSFHMCGVACTRMVLDFLGKKVPPSVSMAKELISFKGFIPQKIELTEEYRSHPGHSQGMFYQPLCNYLLKTFQISARPESYLSLKRIKYLLAANNLVITSVSPEIRSPDSSEKINPGGHLVAVIGYNDKKKTITIHNPSGFSDTQANHEMSQEYFKKYFANRGISIKI